ncbi:MAG: hypothetical protein ACJAV6_000347 [Candidatus Paceibacteria bacterium]|jgi:hypothetical protein
METISQFITEYILIPHAHAAASQEFLALMGRINDNVINPIIIILFTAAFALFTIGLYNLFGSNDNTEGLEKGKRHLVWGIVGMAIMVSVFGIMKFVTGSLGITNVDPSNQIDASVLVKPSR